MSGSVRTLVVMLLLFLAGAGPALAGTPRLETQPDGTVSGTTTLTRQLVQVRTSPRAPARRADLVARRAARFGRVNPNVGDPDVTGEARPGPAPPAVANERRAHDQAGVSVFTRLPILQGASAETSGQTPLGTTFVTSEPSIANNRNVVFATGNDWAAVSDDNGRTWDFTSPDAFNGATDAGPFCCDQQAFAIPRGDHTLIAWMLQYHRPVGLSGDVTGQNAQRMVLLKRPDSLTSLADFPDVNGYCSIVLQPSDFGFDRDTAWLDYPQLGLTDTFLYLTTRVNDGPGSHDVVARFSLAQLDADVCRPGGGITVDRFWVVDGANVMTPVQGNPSTGSVMHFATRKSTAFEGDVLRIWSVHDLTTFLSRVDRNVDNFPDGGRRRCELSGGRGDPCGFLDSRITTGFRAGPQMGVVGWMWTAGQGQGYPFPNVQVAVFDAVSLDKKVDTVLWNPEYAWAYPAAGVNARGELGVLLYRMGGTQLPEARAFVVDDPGAPRSWPPGNTEEVRESNDGVFQDRWGDYYTVRSVDGCRNSFLTAPAAMRGGRRDQDVEVSAAYFGRDGDGCPDLTVTDVNWLDAPDFGQIPAGRLIRLEETTANTGFGSAAQSRTAYYLTRDGVMGPGAVLLKPTDFFGGGLLDPGDSETRVTQVRIPRDLEIGEWRIVTCADHKDKVAEMSEEDNCLGGAAGPGLLVTPPDPLLDPIEPPLDVVLAAPDGVRAVDISDARPVPVNLRISAGAGADAPRLQRTGVTVSLAAGPAAPDVMVLARFRGVRPGARSARRITGRPRPLGRRVSVRLPDAITPGTWYLRTCLVHGRGDRDTRRSNDCRVSAVRVRGRALGRP